MVDAHKCAQCGGGTAQQCQGCKKVRYCNIECQTLHWPKHKFECFLGPEKLLREAGDAAASEITEAPEKEFTIASLKQWNGEEDMPMYIGVYGRILDVSSSANFTAGESYGALWAGSDATYALAKGSLDAEDANKLDWDFSTFEDQEKRQLDGWVKYFWKKYPSVGKLKEYQDREMSDVPTPEEPNLTEDGDELPELKAAGCTVM